MMAATYDISDKPGRAQIVDREPCEVLSTVAFALEYLLHAERRRRARDDRRAGGTLAGLATWAVVLLILAGAL